MGNSDRRDSWPLWVKLGLLGLPNRASAWVFFWFSLAIALGCIVCGFIHWIFFIGGVMVFAAYWYYAAIRWVDRNDTWA